MANTVEMDTLAQLLQDDAGETAQNPVAEETLDAGNGETVVNSRDDDAPQQGTAKDFSVALNKRMEKERQKLEAEVAAKYKADLEFAASMRKLRGDKADADILNDAFEANVRSFAQENGVPDGIARELLALKMNGVNPPKPVNPTTETNPRLTILANQVEEIKQSDGIDMMEVLQNEPGLREKVGKGEWDVTRAYAHYLSSERKRTPPVSKTSNVSDTAINFSNISKSEFDRIDADLKRGVKKRII